ncbi:uncharacterized skeletal organic matrix protein 5-like isoform X2 [Dendronephthya gigantea]|uniref:uncharacterized skeletal organic matrix protein 5-like isoform X2 n=1 Tax=Dendronephthya gigantea TaxID=151771 RepID=UPI00106A5C06|nr:uncharacterized skeletal organic matrix protein 5-like isoform X2 [Dendronephthya gigantea]
MVILLLNLIKNCKDEDFSADTKKCREVEFFHSCKDLLSRHGNSTDGVYSLKSVTSEEDYDVYCHMTDIETCGGGGWTLVMKLDGNKNTFIFDSPLWTNKETYAIQDGLEGLAEKESKLASYWNTPFTKICLGMSYNGDKKWMTFDYNASSLYGVIADGQFRPTTAGRGFLADEKNVHALGDLRFDFTSL